MDTAKLVKNKSDISNFCYDCKKDIEIKDGKIKNGVFLVYNDCGEKTKILKCKDCFKRDKSLSNFKRCEVYSRIVGYLRPVEQWNLGKKQEFAKREEYQIR